MYSDTAGRYMTRKTQNSHTTEACQVKIADLLSHRQIYIYITQLLFNNKTFYTVDVMRNPN